MPVLGLADVSGIQRFLFRQPELQNIALASRRIESFGNTNGLFHSLKTRCIMAAGGNAAFIASTRAELQTAFRRLSRTLLEQGEGLEVIVCIEDYENDSLPQAYQRALGSLDKEKLRQPRNSNFQFSGLTAGLPHPPPTAQPLPARRYGLQEPNEFRNLICLSTEASDLMAVVSIDGIGMGQKLHSWLQGWQRSPPDDEKFIREFHLWSEHLKARWHAAWETARVALENAFDAKRGFELDHPYQLGRKLWLKAQGEPLGSQLPFLPCRRIYQGGDDLSFVCDARIALSLTDILLRALRDLPAPDDIPRLFGSVPASAGIVFVSSHFPFARAIQLADMVRTRAKKKAMDEAGQNGTPVPTLSWWVNRAGATTMPVPSFVGASQKPYLLHSSSLVSWESLDQTMMPGLWNTFGEARGKWKRVIAAAAEGNRGEAVKRLLRLTPLRRGADRTDQGVNTRPFAWAAPYNAESGFNSSGTVLLDLGELFDIHFPFGQHRSDRPKEVQGT